MAESTERSQSNASEDNSRDSRTFNSKDEPDSCDGDSEPQVLRGIRWNVESGKGATELCRQRRHEKKTFDSTAKQRREKGLRPNTLQICNHDVEEGDPNKKYWVEELKANVLRIFDVSLADFSQ
ncbi:unnamed protein product [Calypogeia fissa]